MSYNTSDKLEANLVQFVDRSRDFLNEIYSGSKDEFVKNVLDVYSGLDGKTIFDEIYGALSKKKDEIQMKDDCIFNEQMIIFPGINLSSIWEKMDNTVYDRVWVHLQILLLTGGMVEAEQNCLKELNKKIKKQELELKIKREKKKAEKKGASLLDTLFSSNEPEEEKIKQEPNYFEGIGGVSDGKFGVNEMFSGEIPKEGGGGLGMDGLSQVLDEMKGEKLDEVVKDLDKQLNIKDKNTKNFVNKMLSSFTSEIKNADFKSKNPLQSLFGIAEKIAKDMKPQMDKTPIDINQLLGSTTNLAKKCVPEGEELPEAFNPQNLFNQINELQNANANANANKESVDETNPVELENPVENIQPNKVSKNKKKKKRRNRKKI